MKAKKETTLVPIQGFSQLTKDEKIELVGRRYFQDPSGAMSMFKSFWHDNKDEQKIFDEFSENTLSNFYLPYGVAPNFLINGRLFCVPMVIEESSVVAAAAKSAKFWLDRGGFKTEVVSTHKVGQVHFFWQGEKGHLQSYFNEVKGLMVEEVQSITANMEKRGGGLIDIQLVDKTEMESGYYQLMAQFETCDAMGANFINSIMERFARTWVELAQTTPFLSGEERKIRVIMSILSNYTPNCLVRSWVECPVSELVLPELDMSPAEYAEKFACAVRIAKVDVYRATTHNKGIFNGMDAVVLATGNDFRAVEACGHAYAARKGRYEGLTDVAVEDNIFRFSLEVPLSLGTVGGMTSLHPLARASLELLEQPKATELMGIVACVGLAQNFAAINSLITTGIQKGHMKMHLLNILNQFGATDGERIAAKEHFSGQVVSYGAVRDFLASLRRVQ